MSVKKLTWDGLGGPYNRGSEPLTDAQKAMMIAGLQHTVQTKPTTGQYNSRFRHTLLR